MSRWFEELDYRRTPMGELILQRRRIAALDNAEAYEVKLNGEYLMSSLFHVTEVALAERALARLEGSAWNIAVGGLGLGYTAAAALRDPRVKRLIVVEALEPVIEWHRKGLVPNGRVLADDPRCVFHRADFFALARGNGFDPVVADARFDAVLLDIDHTPRQVLAPAHAAFYAEAGLRHLARFLRPGGVFALWSNEAPEAEFSALLKRVFGRVEGQWIEFDNPLQGNQAGGGVYLAGGRTHLRVSRIPATKPL